MSVVKSEELEFRIFYNPTQTDAKTLLETIGHIKGITGWVIK